LAAWGGELLGADSIHHMCAIVLQTLFCFWRSYELYFPSFQVVELSTIFLNFSWHCIKTGHTNWVPFHISKYAFAVTFFTCRVLWLLWPAFAMTWEPRAWKELGPPRVYFIPSVVWTLYLLQVYWFGKIMRQVLAETGIAFTEHRFKKDEDKID